MIVVVTGVSGAGKTTVGRLLAERLGCGFTDADDFHSPANVAKMRAGTPLDDADRAPWLARLAGLVADWRAAGESRVLACSALKRAYRATLSPNGEAIFVRLDGPPETIAARLAARRGHYMNPALLDSQFATLEASDDEIVVDASVPPEAIVETIVVRLAEKGRAR